MLGFRWLATPAGAPDDPNYQQAVDRLADLNRTPLQSFAKTSTGLDPANQMLQGAVGTWLKDRRLDRVVVMVHGFNFDVSEMMAGTTTPAAAADDPFHRVYAQPGTELAPVLPESWLPIVGETDDAGTQLADCAIGFGWDSDYSFIGAHACLNNGYQYAALDVAPLAARALATLLSTLATRGLAVDVIAHSMGTRVACQALRLLAGGGLTHLTRRVILLEGAEYSVDAYDAITRLPGTQFFNIGNQDDQWPPRGGFASHPFRFNNTVSQRVIAYDGIADLPNLADLQIDRQSVKDWAATQNYTLDSGPASSPGGQTRGEHWAGFIHAGNRQFLRDLLGRHDRSVAWFRDTKAPLGFSRWAYGEIGGNAVPLMPPTCAERTKLLYHH